MRYLENTTVTGRPFQRGQIKYENRSTTTPISAFSFRDGCLLFSPHSVHAEFAYLNKTFLADYSETIKCVFYILFDGTRKLQFPFLGRCGLFGFRLCRDFPVPCKFRPFRNHWAFLAAREHGHASQSDQHHIHPAFT